MHAQVSPIWPQPQKGKSGSAVIRLAPIAGLHLTTVADEPARSLVAAAFKRACARIYLHGPGEQAVGAAAVGASAQQLSGMRVAVRNATTALQLGVDETYQLTVAGSWANITATTVFGAYHALESFSSFGRAAVRFARFSATVAFGLLRFTRASFN